MVELLLQYGAMPKDIEDQKRLLSKLIQGYENREKDFSLTEIREEDFSKVLKGFPSEIKKVLWTNDYNKITFFGSRSNSNNTVNVNSVVEVKNTC